MTRDDVLAHCAAHPGAVEDYPFGEGVAVFKVGGRMFAPVPIEGIRGEPSRRPGTVTDLENPSDSSAIRALSTQLKKLSRRHRDEIAALEKTLAAAHGENLELKRRLAQADN